MAIEWLDIDRKHNRFNNHGEFATFCIKPKSKRIYISANMARKSNMANKQYAKIGIDRQEKMMVIKSLPEEQEGCIKLYNGGGGNKERISSKTIVVSKVIRIANELAELKQSDKNTERYKCEYDEERDMLKIYFDKPLSDKEFKEKEAV
ncbi:MAG: hypothetical protein ACOCRX_00665 [Candidatus Woesearchaeota archaeon]